MSYRLFAVTAPGLEPLVMTELANLGLSAQKPTSFSLSGEPVEETGGVEFEASRTDLYRANLWLRTANRIIYRLGEFRAVSFPELRKKAARLPWETVLSPGQPVAIRVTCRKSRLYHSDGVAERVAGAIQDALKQPVPLKKFDESSLPLPQLIIVRFSHDECVISVDTSGALLHRRGYRLETAKAPLRESLAAGMLLASGWDRQSPLVDPFCGSGTIPIEAAMMARKIAPGKNRQFAFMDWPGFNKKNWEKVLQQATSHEIRHSPVIQASDRDAGAIRIAKENADRAGVLNSIQFECLAISAVQPAGLSGWIVTNPPYGVRISPGRDMRDLYARFGDVLREKYPAWHTAILSSSDVLYGQLRLPAQDKIQLINGGIPVSLYLGRVE
ncbi:MAG: class I SAM-dependent RNA methyltransferase [Leptolinea sp.]|nr:class I SAM-dependent RNA methyltransferase [Leptolinea sp.]